MSQLSQDYTAPAITTVNGFATEDTILEIVSQIEVSSNASGDAIGNINGNGDYQYDESRNITSLSATIGSTSSDPAEPRLESFSNFTESYSLISSKSITMTLIADTLEPILITDGSNPTSFWNLKATKDQLLAVGDYYISGRELIFYKAPTSSFSITYSGTYPGFFGDIEGYRPNILPNPRSTTSINKPALTIELSGRLRVSVASINTDPLHSSDLDGLNPIVLSAYIDQFKDGSGTLSCPLEYIGMYRKDGNYYKKLEVQSIHIIDETTYEAVTSEVIDTVNDIIVIALANTSLWENVSIAIKSLSTHSHNGEDGSQKIRHSDLHGLIPKAISADVNYGGSGIEGNDHPQLFMREGLINDPSTYNNAILGDVFMSSSNKNNLFDNTLADSRSIILGSTDSGHSIRRRAIEADVLLTGTGNGFSVTYNNSLYNYGLRINNHKFADTINNLRIESASGKTVFGSALALNDIELDTAICNDVNVLNDITIAANGALTIGNISFSAVGNNLTVTSNSGLSKIVSGLNIEAEEANIQSATINTLNLEPLSKVIFGANGQVNASYFTTIDNKCTYVSDATFDIRNTGKATGLAWKDGNQLNLSIYTSANDGSTSSNTNNDMYAEVNSGNLYVLKSTLVNQEDDGVEYSWKNITATRVDDLRQWPQANINAKEVISKKQSLSKSNGEIKNGISFDSQTGIWATSANQLYPGNMLIIEAPSGVSFTQGNSVDFSNVLYSDIACMNATIHGKAIISSSAKIDGGIETTRIDVEDVVVSGSLSMDAGSEAKFYGTVLFSDNITFNDDVQMVASANINTLSVTGNSIFTGTVKTIGEITADDLTVTGNTTIGVDDPVSTNLINGNTFFNTGKLQSNVISDFTESVKFKSDVSFSDPITANEVNINGIVTTKATVNSETINVKTLNVTGSANIQSVGVNTDFAVSGKITCSSLDATSEIKSQGDAIIQGKMFVTGETALSSDGAKTKIMGPLEITGGDDINCSGGKIVGLVMDPGVLPYNYDSNPAAVIDRPNDATNRAFVINEVRGALRVSLLAAVYPLGTLYSNVANQANPGTAAGPFGSLFFGKWEPFAEGQFIAGKKDGMPGFITANQTGGKSGHEMTSANLIEHDHNRNAIGVEETTTHMGAGGTDGVYVSGSGNYLHKYTKTGKTGSATPTPIPTLPPYVVAAIWVRTA